MFARYKKTVLIFICVRVNTNKCSGDDMGLHRKEGEEIRGATTVKALKKARKKIRVLITRSIES